MPTDAKPDNLQVVFQGGSNTAVETANIPAGEYSRVQNMRGLHPGLKTRPGQSALHTTAYALHSVISLYQFSKAGKTERHLYAQMGNNTVLEATNNPPAVTTGAFGASVYGATGSAIPAAWTLYDDMLLFANSIAGAQACAGSARTIEQMVVYLDSAPTGVPTVGQDVTIDVSDADTTTYATVGGIAAAGGRIYFRTLVPANAINLTVHTANTTAGKFEMNYYNGAWASVSVTDGSTVGGVPLAVTGAVSWSPPADELPTFQFGEDGYWYELYLSGGSMDAGTKVSEVTYDTAWEPVEDLWDGTGLDATEVQVYRAATGQYQVYGASEIDLSSVGSADIIYVAAPYKCRGLYIDPGTAPNSASVALDMLQYHDGQSWASVAFIDGAAGLTRPGWTTFPRNDARMIQFNAGKNYAYWYRFGVADTMEATRDDYSISLMPYFSISEKGNCLTVEAWKDRACYVFAKAPQYIYVSAQNRPCTINGSDSAILQAGDGRKNRVVAMKKFYNELLAFQEERGTEGGCITLFEGYSPATFGKLVLSTRVGTMSAKTIDVVDGVLVGTRTDEKLKTLAFTLSRYGVFMIDGTVVAPIHASINNYWDPTKDECIRRGYEHECWLKFDSAFNVLRLGIVSGPTATKPNIFPVFDLRDMCWYFDVFEQPLCCLCEVEAATGNIPILQVAGGTADGYIYCSNHGQNDVSAAIDSYVDVEIDGGGQILTLREITVRIKSGEGTCTATVYQDGSLAATKTIP